MRVLKKVGKIVLVVGSLLAFTKFICKICRLTIRMEKYNEHAVFKGKSKKYENEPFEKDSIAAIFSGVDLNFKKATMKGESSSLDILGRYSGISVKVPDTWKVEMDGKAVQSGISTRFKDNSDVEDAPLLKINYDIKYCGFDVANPKSEDLLDDNEVIEEVIEEIIEEFIEEVIEEVIEYDNEEELVEDIIE